MYTHWYYLDGIHERGPLTLAGLQRLVDSELLMRTTQVRARECDDWMFASDVPGLFPDSPTSEEFEKRETHIKAVNHNAGAGDYDVNYLKTGIAVATIALVIIGVISNLPNKTTRITNSIQRDSIDANRNDDLRSRADAAHAHLIQKVIRGDTDFSDITREVDDLKADAQRYVRDHNRRPGEPGYSIEVRREAAVQMLIDRGEPPHEARITVQLMEERGLLPDLPRK